MQPIGTEGIEDVVTTKVKEISDRPQHSRNQCPICNPKNDRVREDQVWGHCPTNQKHKSHRA